MAPDACRFDPRTLVCTGAASADCLDAPQAAARDGDLRRAAHVRRSGARPRASRQARKRGGVAGRHGSRAPHLARASRRRSPRERSRHMVFQRPDYDLRSFDFERDPAAVETKLGPVLNATEPDLSAFHKRGGKLILFHGWNDPALSVYETIDYYQAVRARMGNAVDAFARLYLIPGLQHCTSGHGATYIGGLNVPFRDARAGPVRGRSSDGSRRASRRARLSRQQRPTAPISRHPHRRRRGVASARTRRSRCSRDRQSR